MNTGAAWGLVLTAALAGLAVEASEARPGLVAAPLAPRSQPAGATMFTTLAPEDTGVVTVNRYADPAMWGQYYQELAFGAMGCGVAVGDFDNDGRPDIFTVSKTERCRLFRNLGGWRFEDVTRQAGLAPPTGRWAAIKEWFGRGDEADEAPIGTWHQGASFADVNNDGWLDLYVCRFRAPNLLYINQGNGTFREEAAARGLALDDASGIGAFCDYDRDGWLDVYVQTSMRDVTTHPHGQPDRLYRNNGDGTFTDVTAAAGIAGESCGHSVTWWDYDGDGWPDLYVANDYAVPDRLYRNNRDGTFTDVIARVAPHIPYYAMGADLGDVDNDGLIDLLVGDMAPTSHEKDQRGMAGSRSRAQTYLDGAATPQLMRNALFLNTGLGVMREGAHLAGVAATDWTWSVRLEDFDNDGQLDLHVTNGMTREYHNADLLDKVMAVEDRAGSRRVLRDSPVLAEANLAFRNLGDVAFQDVSAAWGLNQTGVSFGAASGDFDGDGDLDLVFANYEAGHTLMRNDSVTGNRAVITLRGTTSNRWGVGATVRLETVVGRQVRTLAVARGYLSSSEPVLHFGLGDADVIHQLTVHWPSGHVQAFASLPVNRHFTITEPPGSATPREVDPQPTQFVRTDLPPEALAKRRRTEGDPLLQPLMPWRIDPVTRDSTESRWLDAVPTEVPRAFAVVATADFDHDGHPEVWVGARVRPGRYPLPPRSELWRQREGTWIDVTDTLAPGLREVGMVTAALATDVDGDGWPDLVIALEWGGIRLFRNNQGRGFEDHSEAGGFSPVGTGWWRALAVADFNGDGRADIVAGNVGLNTFYRASATHPALLFQGDFRGGGGADQLLEGYFEGDRLRPRRTRNDLAAQIPAIARRHPRVDDYARATLEEIAGRERLARARRLVATELRSGVWLSQPDGRWRFEPLPRIAQIAPASALAVADFDRDGHADLFIAQNSHAPIPSVGPFAGGVGQLLRGDGRGGFTAVAPSESGLIVTGEAIAVEVVDFDQDGWPDLIVSRRDGGLIAYRNQGAARMR